MLRLGLTRFEMVGSSSGASRVGSTSPPVHPYDWSNFGAIVAGCAPLVRHQATAALHPAPSTLAIAVLVNNTHKHVYGYVSFCDFLKQPDNINNSALKAGPAGRCWGELRFVGMAFALHIEYMQGNVDVAFTHSVTSHGRRR